MVCYAHLSFAQALYQALLLAPLACNLHIVIPNSTIMASMLRCKVQPVEGSTVGGPVAGPAYYRELVQGPHGELVKKIFDELTKREKEGWRMDVHLGGPDDHRRPVSHAVWAYQWVPASTWRGTKVMRSPPCSHTYCTPGAPQSSYRRPQSDGRGRHPEVRGHLR